MPGAASIVLAAQDFEATDISVQRYTTHGQVCSARADWIISGEPRYLRLLAAALAEAAAKAEATASRTPAGAA